MERNSPGIAMNEKGSKKRPEQLIRKLQRNGQYQDYNNIIQEN